MAGWACASCGGENPEGMRFCGHCGAPRAELARTDQAEAERDVADALRSFVADQVADHLIESGGKLPEERRLITALFADVSGFTSLADRLDPEHLLEVIDPVISGLSNIVGRYEGYVEKFAGDALLALFGAPVTHEDDAERALRVALEMHSELARLCADLPHDAELTLHVGVNSGHGIARILGSETRMDYAVLGDSVILAQRLESAAPPGETYVSEMTVRLAESRFEFESVGELTLKGKREPVSAWRLIGERTKGRSATRKGVSTELVGREPELATLTEALERLAHGGGAVVALTGEPGVGKSRLTVAARAAAEERGFQWLEGRCVSYGAGLAYWPYLELLRDFAGIRLDDPPDEAAARLDRALDAIGMGRELPFFAAVLGMNANGGSTEAAKLEPEAFRRALHRAFTGWVEAAAHRQPLVIAIEDVHWADASTVALTAELSQLCLRASVLFYVIARPEGEHLLAEMAVERTTIRLERLSESAVDRLVESILGASSPAELASFVVGRTGGNPFFVEEILRSLRETEALVRENENWTMRPGWDARTLPETIEEVLSARIDLLPRPAASVLQTASVLGRRVPLPLLDEVATDVADLPGAIDHLVASAFLDRVEEEGEHGLAFHHALVQDTAYSRILRKRRRELHLQVAEAAEALYGAGDDSIDLLARHLYLGEAGAKALEYLVRAGERAKRLFANEEAILHLQRAADVAEGDASLSDRLPEIQLSIADLHELVGDYDEAIRLYSAARDATNDVRTWSGIASTLRKQGKYREALTVVEEAFSRDELKEVDTTPLWLEQGWTLSVAGRVDQAIEVLQAGLAAAPLRRTPVVGRLLLQLARAETVAGQFEDAVAHGLEARGIFEQHDDLRGVTTTMRIVGDAYRRLGRLDEAAAALGQGLELAERIGTVEEIGGCLINLGIVNMQREMLTEATTSLRRAIDEFERVGHGAGRALGYATLAETLVHCGELDEALEFCEKALEVAKSIEHPLATADAIQTIASIRLRQGDFGEAASKAEEAASLFLDVGAAPAASDALGIATEAWQRAGERERAEETSARARSLV
jgi:class 3 adenylate cyclase/tetratricopeptide (TPR) repeat protein